MNSNSPVSQEATLGAHDNTFVAQQNNYGLSATAALDMALQLSENIIHNYGKRHSIIYTN